MSWGGPTCNGNHPDVFADVSKAVGFIDWATRCVEGQDVDHYKFGQKYTRWAKRQYCKRKDEIKIRKQKVNYNPEKMLRKKFDTKYIDQTPDISYLNIFSIIVRRKECCGRRKAET